MNKLFALENIDGCERPSESDFAEIQAGAHELQSLAYASETASTAIEQLKRLETFNNYSSEQYNFAIECIAAPIGGPEGFVPTIEGLGSMLKNVGKKIWETLKKIWEKIKAGFRWIFGMADPAEAVLQENLEKLYGTNVQIPQVVLPGTVVDISGIFGFYRTNPSQTYYTRDKTIDFIFSTIHLKKKKMVTSVPRKNPLVLDEGNAEQYTQDIIAAQSSVQPIIPIVDKILIDQAKMSAEAGTFANFLAADIAIVINAYTALTKTK